MSHSSEKALGLRDSNKTAIMYAELVQYQAQAGPARAYTDCQAGRARFQLNFCAGMRSADRPRRIT